ncbi:MAG TPA: hypothetical protein PK156_44825 [Polyangium sp.]|nr:hypothetical protein [Polyangium sp.]
MEAWATEFITVWEKNRVQFAQAGLDAIQGNPLLPVKEYSLSDSLQFLDGTTAMMREVLTGSGTDVRDMYFNSVIPGIIAQGQPVSGFVAQVTLVAVVFASSLLPQIRKKHRDQAAKFLAEFYMEFNYQIVKIGMEMGAKS